MSRGGRPRGHPTRQRTCLGCRAVRGQGELARLAVDARGLVLDARLRAGGRGAWVCRSEPCVRRATRQLARALRIPGLAPAPDELWALVRGEVEALGAARPEAEAEGPVVFPVWRPPGEPPEGGDGG